MIKGKQHIVWHHQLILFKFTCLIHIFLVLSLLLHNTFTSDIIDKKHIFEAESAELKGGASKVAASFASGGNLVSLSKPGEGIRFKGIPAANKLAIRYASSGVGLISVVV